MKYLDKMRENRKFLVGIRNKFKLLPKNRKIKVNFRLTTTKP